MPKTKGRASRKKKTIFTRASTKKRDKTPKGREKTGSSDIEAPNDPAVDESASNFMEPAESETYPLRQEVTSRQAESFIEPAAQETGFSELLTKKMTKELKSAMKPGKEKEVPYRHSLDLADPWEKKERKKDPNGSQELLKELFRAGEEPGPENPKKRWPTKQGTLTLDMQEYMDEIPMYLKDLGIMKLFQRIIMNLYMMNPRPKNPCLEIFHLLDKWFGASDKSKAVETLEREYHTQLLKEMRIVQEIGKLKALCHFLLPEEYGINGEILKRTGRVYSDDDMVLVEYGDESEAEVSECSQRPKKSRRKKEKGRPKLSISVASLGEPTKTSTRGKTKKKVKIK